MQYAAASAWPWLRKVKRKVGRNLTDLVHNTFRVFAHMANDEKHVNAFNGYTTLAPVEFIMCAFLIGKHMNSHSIDSLAEAIADMRAYARKKHADGKNNSRVRATMLEFITEKIDPETPVPSVNAIEESRTNNKRSRSVDSDDTHVATRLYKKIKVGSPEPSVVPPPPETITISPTPDAT